MRLGAIDGDAVILHNDRYRRAADATGGAFVTPSDVYADFERFSAAISGDDGWHDLDPATLGAPVPEPGQVFGVGLNYHDHLEEAGRGGQTPLPLTFTKFPSSIIGPDESIEIPTDSVDFEVELVLVLSRLADRVAPGTGWDYVAGVTIGQDISARGVQIGGQLSLAKSFRTFAPIGPAVVTLDELEGRDSLGMRCWVNDHLLQDSNTSLMVHSVSELVPFLSAFTPLRPGDLVFTGTGAGVGLFRKPPVFLRPGDVVKSEIEQLGTMTNPCVAPADPDYLPDAISALGADRIAEITAT